MQPESESSAESGVTEAFSNENLAPEESPGSIRGRFMRMAFLFQGGLFLASLAVGWLCGIPVRSRLNVSLGVVLIGLMATAPMLLFLAFVYRTSISSFVQIRDLLRDTLGEYLAAATWYDLVSLSILAGVSEEFLFRGTIEPLVCRWNWPAGFVISNILFGLCHAVTPTYAVLATLIGGYLSLTVWMDTQPSLVIPIICHSVYDLVAFVVVRMSYEGKVEGDGKDGRR